MEAQPGGGTTKGPATGSAAHAGTGAAALFAREHEPMVHLAALLVGSAPVAEEIVQDAFVTVAQRWTSLGNPGGYLRTCVVNGCRMVLRRQATERHRYRVLGAGPDTFELPTHLVEVRDALDRLDERQRIVIVLRYFVDLPDREIAEVLGCAPATVRSLAHRALRVLRKELDQ